MDTYEYLAEYKGKKIIIQGENDGIYGAQLRAAKELGAKNSWKVSIAIYKKNGEIYEHSPCF
jgi:hypothetical protein